LVVRLVPTIQAALPLPQPSVIFDKSAFQGLSRDEHAERLFRYRENITPILLHEILADLAKADADKSSEATVQILARKFLGGGGVINADHRTLCVGELTGRGHFEADGRPVVGEYYESHEADGSTAILVEPTAANRAILRWASAHFSTRERSVASSLRAAAGALSIESMYGRLRQYHVLLPRPKSISEIPVIADDLLTRANLQPAFLDWLMEQLRLPTHLQVAVAQRWSAAGRPPLARFSAYAHHCTRVLLLLLIGMRHNVLSTRKTNRLDAEYLFYVPFCEVFVSGDALHAQLAPMVLGEGRRFVPVREFKAQMAAYARERKEPRGTGDANKSG
jgi:hypothetical protein